VRERYPNRLTDGDRNAQIFVGEGEISVEDWPKAIVSDDDLPVDNDSSSEI